MKRGVMKTDIRLAGTLLTLREGETVLLSEASNLPQGGWFAVAADNPDGFDILVRESEFEFIREPLYELMYNDIRLAVSSNIGQLREQAERIYEGWWGFEKVAVNHWRSGDTVVRIRKVRDNKG